MPIGNCFRMNLYIPAVHCTESTTAAGHRLSPQHIILISDFNLMQLITTV